MTKQFPALKNDLIFRVIKGEKVERTPIWIMRQAGRYLPGRLTVFIEFREVRKHHDFFEVVETPELCSQITIQPITRYDFDAAIIFSDILIVCQAIGIRVNMVPGKGPVIENPIVSPADIKKLDFNINIETAFKYLLDGITLTRFKLEGRCPLIGFCGAPWTLMCYMVDSDSKAAQKSLSGVRKWLFAYPDDAKHLLNQTAEIVGNLLVKQYEAGAQVVIV
ncbi:Uroporphyrinogen decarboxylase [Thelohanellus kitauei]|uniref:Uroporphyrinogen decarboxylase n=1 Tax=Thelohanellus kitauei TaxID=669202 RepID=A0A0C2MZ59_THEKT|nr:Uroporphyrinogen decarboxylase [Thelohanellus kitauei]